MALGDKIVVGIPTGDTVQTVEIVADKAGREVTFNRDARAGTTTVEVAGRAGTVVRTAIFRDAAIAYMMEVKRELETKGKAK